MNPDDNPYDCDDLSVRASSACFKLAVATWRELSEMTERDVLRTKGCGRKTVMELRLFLEEMGLRFKPPPPPVQLYGPARKRLGEIMMTPAPQPCLICQKQTVFGLRYKFRVRATRWFCENHLVACVAELFSTQYLQSPEAR